MKRYRPDLEALEGRLVPSTVVDSGLLSPPLASASLSGSGNSGSGNSGSGNSGSGGQVESRSVFDTDLTSTTSTVVGEAKLETRTRNGETQTLFKVELSNAPAGAFPISITVDSTNLTGSIVVANGVGQLKVFKPSFTVAAGDAVSVTVDFGGSGGLVTLQGTFEQKK